MSLYKHGLLKKIDTVLIIRMSAIILANPFMPAFSRHLQKHKLFQNPIPIR